MNVWGLAPRLLQDHSPIGEAHCKALVKRPTGSGEFLVTRIDAGSQTAKTPLVAGRDWCEEVGAGRSTLTRINPGGESASGKPVFNFPLPWC